MKLRTPAVFTKTFLKIGNFIDVRSYNWVPQSSLHGAISASMNQIYERPLNLLEKIHLTSASPTCPRCSLPTFFHLPDIPMCPKHGEAKPKTVMLLHTVGLNPQRWQPLMLDYPGELTVHRRMNPRRFYALRPEQEFSFLAYAEDKKAEEAFDEAMDALSIKINGRKALGVMSIGWGKKLGWGGFDVEWGRWSDCPASKRGPGQIGILQSPLTSADGDIYMLQTVKKVNVQTRTIKVRNIHYSSLFSRPTVYAEGSQVSLMEKTSYYPTDDKDWAIGFTHAYYRHIDRSLVKALEASLLVHRGKFESVKA